MKNENQIKADPNMGFINMLRKQSPEFQNKVLGTERAKLFRNGKLSIDRFTNDKGQILTLKQLKKENPGDI